ncbi:transketolase family protein [Alkalibacillus aidingensis]|uniref:transketolase family protein n=1 Tax=Alkalibacillus aidingensis TaxID=2747607 RepID=UPI00166139DD|nr:transketolase C-terminal domain-containing protein [Alkalibacillus aidingensis]
MATSVRDEFGSQLAKLANEDSRVVALDGDLGNSTRLATVEKETDDSFLQMGIAEQNMLGVAAGLSTVGFQPWVCSFATFLTKRAYDQIVVSVAQTHADVKMVGAYSGLLTSNTGKTHHSLDDLGMLSMVPNMTVIVTGDANETATAMKAMHEYEGPVYLRLTRDETIENFTDEAEFEIGKGRVLQEGNDMLIISTGSMTSRVIEAIDGIENLSIYHVHMPTIKPLDKELLLQAASHVDVVVTVEEHYIRGGLGSIVSEVLAEHDPKKVYRVGVEDEYSGCGTNEELLDAHGLSPEKVREKILAYGKRE